MWNVIFHQYDSYKLRVTQRNPNLTLLTVCEHVIVRLAKYIIKYKKHRPASQQQVLFYYLKQSGKLILVEAMCILLLLGVALWQGGGLVAAL